MFVVWVPNQYDLLSQVDTDLTNQGEIESDLGDLADSGAFEPLCLPISVPNHRAVPRLAFDLEVRPSHIVSSSEQRTSPAAATSSTRPAPSSSTTSSSTPTTPPASPPRSPRASTA